MRKTIHYIDMFAGMGGFREGLTRAGDFVCMGHCEIDKYADRSYGVKHVVLPADFCKPRGEGQPEDIPERSKKIVEEYAQNVVWPLNDLKEGQQRVFQALIRGEAIKVPLVEEPDTKIVPKKAGPNRGGPQNQTGGENGQAEKAQRKKEPKEKPKGTSAGGKDERKKQQRSERKLAGDAYRQNITEWQNYWAYLRMKAYEQWFMERTKQLPYGDYAGKTPSPSDPIPQLQSQPNGHRVVDKKAEQFWDYLLIWAAKVWRNNGRKENPTSVGTAERKEDPDSA